MKGLDLNYSPRQPEPEFSRLSIESKKKLNYLKIIIFLGLAFFSYLVYYFQLLPREQHELFSFFLIMSISCNLIPIPTYPIILYISHDYSLWLIVLVGTIGATISALFEYNIVDFIMKFDRVALLTESRRYQKFARYFDRFSFTSIMVASSIPLPLDFIRIMAITRRYPKIKFLLATMLGRIPRFTIVVFLGMQLAHPRVIAGLLIGITLALELTRRLIKLLQRVPAAERST